MSTIQFSDLKFGPHPIMPEWGIERAEVWFAKNGYGLSVLRGIEKTWFYPKDLGYRFETCMLGPGFEEAMGVPHKTVEEVQAALDACAALPPARQL